jgi:hypothetical protein
MIEYRFRVTSAVIFTLYSYSKFLEYHLEYATTASLSKAGEGGQAICICISMAPKVKAQLLRAHHQSQLRSLKILKIL